MDTRLRSMEQDSKAAAVCAGRARGLFHKRPRRRINGFLKLPALWAVLLRGQNPAEAFKPRGIRPRSVPSRLLHVHRFGQELLVVVLVAVQLALPPRGVADGLRVRPGAQAVVQVHEARHIAAGGLGLTLSSLSAVLREKARGGVSSRKQGSLVLEAGYARKK